MQAPKEKLENVDDCYKSLLGNGVAIHDMPLGYRLMNTYKMSRANLTKGVQESYLKITSKTPSWNCIVNDSKDGSKLLLPGNPPRNSVCAVATHRGDQTLYGVAYSSVVVEQTPNSRHIILEGITILPSGPLWISLALRCVGGNLNEINVYENNKIPQYATNRSIKKSKFSYPDKDDAAFCDYIQDRLIDDLQIILPNIELIKDINKLFESWIFSERS